MKKGYGDAGVKGERKAVKRQTTDKPLCIGVATVMVNQFEAGQSMDQIALRHGFTREEVEQLMRRTLIARPRRKGRL